MYFTWKCFTNGFWKYRVYAPNLSYKLKDKLFVTFKSNILQPIKDTIDSASSFFLNNTCRVAGGVKQGSKLLLNLNRSKIQFLNSSNYANCSNADICVAGNEDHYQFLMKSRQKPHGLASTPSLAVIFLL